MILIILLLILLYFVLFNKENFDVLADTQCGNNCPSDIYYENNEDKSNINCCIMHKTFGDGVTYNLKKASGNMCNPSLYNIDSNNQLYIENKYSWDNKECYNNNMNMGSCRNSNKECVDFKLKKDCDEFNMVWSDVSCHSKMIPKDNYEINNSNTLISNNNKSQTSSAFPVIKNDPTQKTYNNNEYVWLQYQ